MPALELQITNAGRAALINAANTGTNAVTIAAVGVSSSAIVPSATATVLPGEIKRLATFSGAAVADDVVHIVVRDETDASYTLRSFALYLNNGILFAIYGQPGVILEKSAGALMLLAVDATLAEIDASSIAFGDANFLNPPATTTTPGVARMATPAEAATGTSTALIISPYTMKVSFSDVWRASNDGAGSGLDADLLDGRQSAEFALLSGAAFTGGISVNGGITAQGGVYADPNLYMTMAAATLADLSFDSGDVLRFDRTENRWDFISSGNTRCYITSVGVTVPGTFTAGTVLNNGSQVWHVANDGAGSGLDADLLDGLQGAAYAKFGQPAGFADIQASRGTGEGALYLGNLGHYLLNDGSKFVLSALPLMVGGGIVYHANNDGAGSGLDSDLLDGRQAAEFALLAGAGFNGPVSATLVTSGGGAGIGSVVLVPGAPTRTGYQEFRKADGSRTGYIGWALENGPLMLMSESGAGYSVEGGPLRVQGGTAFHSSNDGAGSGLDADLLDGLQAAAFALAQHGHSAADLAGAFANAQLSPSGYQVLPNGLIIQWFTGSVLSSGNESAQTNFFPIAFPNSCFIALPGTRLSSSSAGGDAWFQIVGAPTTASCVLQRQRGDQDNVSSAGLVIAIGN